ncbi:heavy metal response regulator transcription factor [Roseateles terrae]|uniref:Two-component system copper resistance phosphate regulon response regulator CusR n=1 Tax=Roseateles terrae TaxID=431060 RepID=A0ABR6GPY9_9BURK|nr:heavy metal response regulator transcription factor [Roseateles terrae]MBB3193304.1 two-component system copper resistance phosphate regulon response regulator CusR [Roseateles terrae]OWQ89491.1 DNA-binding response regulator [Roseateles terrae]
MRILVVEDEARAGDYLKQGLGEAGFVVDVATDGHTGLHLAMAQPYDLIVLDVMLPGLDGWTVLRRLRQTATGRQVPVLFLSARDALADRVQGLELGADDYLVKPFAFAELLARIRTLLRRGPQREDDVLAMDDLRMNVPARTVTRAGQRLHLSAREFNLLHLLMRRQGEVLSRSEIASQVWDMNFDSDTNVVDVAMRRLRLRINDPVPGRLIHAVRGMGYVCELRE